MSDNTNRKSVVYCRAATTALNRPNSSTIAQEARCRDYAAQQGYKVVRVFHDIAISGNAIDRPSFNAMLTFLRNQDDAHVVLVDNSKRLARSLETFFKLRQTIRDTGGILEFPTTKLDDDAKSQFIKRLTAAGVELERKLIDQGR